jgi:hypothetical protein
VAGLSHEAARATSPRIVGRTNSVESDERGNVPIEQTPIAGVQFERRAGVSQPADRHDAPTLNSHLAPEPGVAGTIDYSGVANTPIKHRIPPMVDYELCPREIRSPRETYNQIA